MNIIVMINRLMPINGRSKIQDITSLLTQYNTTPGVLQTLNDIMKQGRVSLYHGGLILPSSFINLTVIPMHFQLDHGALLKLHFSFVQYMSRLRGKLPIRFHMLRKCYFIRHWPFLGEYFKRSAKSRC